MVRVLAEISGSIQFGQPLMDLSTLRTSKPYWIQTSRSQESWTLRHSQENRPTRSKKNTHFAATDRCSSKRPNCGSWKNNSLDNRKAYSSGANFYHLPTDNQTSDYETNDREIFNGCAIHSSGIRTRSSCQQSRTIWITEDWTLWPYKGEISQS